MEKEENEHENRENIVKSMKNLSFAIVLIGIIVAFISLLAIVEIDAWGLLIAFLIIAVTFISALMIAWFAEVLQVLEEINKKLEK